MDTSTAARVEPTIKNHRARIEEQDRVAAERGFAFREQTFYPWGTEMLQVGKDAVRERRRKIEDLPLAKELPAVADEIVQREQRRDYTADMTALSLDTETGLLRTRADSRGASISDWAFSQLLARAGAPGAAGSYLAACPPDLRAPHFAHWMKRGISAKGASKEVVLRTRLGDGGLRGVYAAVSPKYQPYDAPDALRDIASAVDPSGRAKLRYDGRRWSCEITYFVPYEPVVGDVQHGFVRVWSADDGSDSIHFKGGLFRVRCLNATLIPAVQTLEPVRHTRKEMVELIRERIAQTFRMIAPFAEQFAEASRQEIVERVYHGVEAKYIFWALVANGLLHATGCPDEELVARCVRAWEVEPGYQRADIVNAITRAAHAENWTSAWVTDELEEQAGQLLYNYVVYSPADMQAAAPEGSSDIFSKLEID